MYLFMRSYDSLMRSEVVELGLELLGVPSEWGGGAVSESDGAAAERERSKQGVARRGPT